jgi:hypothetical protein
MIFFVDNVIADPELGLLADLYEFLDSKLEKLCDESVLCNDAESSGYYDQIEYLTGFGLIALQTYLTETSAFFGLRKHETFDLGPKTSSGVSKIKILNAAANFWKHREEWIFKGEEKQAEAVSILFGEVGYSIDTDYPISGVLTELLDPLEVRFSSLLIPVRAWRDDLIRSKHTESVDRNGLRMATTKSNPSP